MRLLPACTGYGQVVSIPGHLRVRLSGDTHAPEEARHHVRRVLRDYSPEVVRDAELVASELVTNALQHGGQVRWFAADPDEGVVEIAVADSSVRPPAPVARPGITGRGLRVVNQLSDDWGYQGDEDGKVVWSVLDTRQR